MENVIAPVADALIEHAQQMECVSMAVLTGGMGRNAVTNVPWNAPNAILVTLALLV
jgi:hypothetical protein